MPRCHRQAARRATKTVSDFEHLSAFFDGESVPSDQLLAALRRPRAMEFLTFMARLRAMVQEDAAVPDEAWVRAMRARLRTAEQAGAQDQIPGPSPHDVTVSTCLSHRQCEVLACIFEGCSEKQVAARLGVGQSTVHTHLRRLHRKLRAHNRAELLASARRMASTASTAAGTGSR